MTGLTETLWTYLTGGQIKEFFIVLFNQYFPFGSIFWMIGFTILIILHLKTKNLAFACIPTMIYFLVISSSGLVVNAYSATGMKYFGIILGLVIGFYLYRGVKK